MLLCSKHFTDVHLVYIGTQLKTCNLPLPCPSFLDALLSPRYLADSYRWLYCRSCCRNPVRSSQVHGSQVHGSLVLKTISLKSFNWISATRFAVLMQLETYNFLKENASVLLEKDFIIKFISKFVYIWLTISSCYGSFPLTLVLIVGGMLVNTLCHSCGFDYQRRVLKTFTGPGYLCFEDGVV